MGSDKVKELIDKSVKELTEDLEKGYSDRIQSYLTFKARFHKYSYGNVLAIEYQNPEATFVKGFMQWKEMGYYVKAGTKAIGILAPMSAKYIEKTDRDGNKYKVFWKSMSEMDRKNTKEHQIYKMFKPVYVFDIKDTNCEDYPTFFSALGNSHEQLYHLVKDRLTESGVVIVENEGGKAEGSYSPLDLSIKIKKQDKDNMLLAMLHEMGHYLCYKLIDNYKEANDYKAGELHAESVAFIVGKFIGIDNPFSKDYILNWKGSTDKIREHLALIDTVSTEFINIISKEDEVLYATA